MEAVVAQKERVDTVVLDEGGELNFDISVLERAGWRRCSADDLLAALYYALHGYVRETIIGTWTLWWVYDDETRPYEIVGVLYESYSGSAWCWRWDTLHGPRSEEDP